MNHTFKTFGLLLASIFAMCAVGASAASAATAFHASNAPVNISGSQTVSSPHVFTIEDFGAPPWDDVTCGTVTLTGTQTSLTSETMTLTPTYQNCKAFGFINVPIDVNGCAYIFKASGTASIECAAGKSIQITVPGCTFSIGAQDFPSGMTYATGGTTPNRDITASANISSITYNECGLVHSDGITKGSFTLKSALGEIWVS